MDEDRKERIRYYTFATFVGLLLLLNWLGIFKTIFGFDTAILVTVLAGYKTFYNSISALMERRISADIALCIAVIAALSVGQYLAAAEAMFIVLVGEGLESYAAGRTAAAIQRFVEQMPRRARLLRDGQEIDVDAASLLTGDRILVPAGERIPADGEITSGHSAIDESSITGEPLPREKAPGEEVFSGSLNGRGMLEIRVTRAGEDTTLARVVQLVKEAEERRAPVERLADRVAVWFLPALLLAAALTFFFTRDWMRTVAVLIVACPCALILATPTAMVAAIGGLARRGILVRGASVLQLAAKVDTVVFDKTGTITEGRFEIVRIIGLDRPEDQLLALAAAAERASDHPLARVIVDEADRRHLTPPAVENAQVLPGRGIEASLLGRTVRAGNANFIGETGAQIPTRLLDDADSLGATAVWLAVEGHIAGAVFLRDRVRDGVEACTGRLRDMEIGRLLMLTGDRRRAADAIAREAGIPEVEAELLPEQKLDRVRQLSSEGRTVAMVGDGINDAPALAQAAVGVAVAGASAITAEAAAVVYLPHSLEGLPEFFRTSRRAVATAWQNIILFAGLLNLTAVVMAATGQVGPIGAALTHQLSSFFVMMNSLRLLRVGGGGRALAARMLGSLAGRANLPDAWDRLRHAASLVDPEAGLAWFAENRPRLVKPAVVVAAALVVLNGIYIISPDEIGIVQRFGRKLQPYDGPGIHYKLPWPIDQLTRVQARRVRVVEIGFRTSATTPAAEPAAYEWNAQHRSGRYERRPEEALMLTGDQNMIELNATVHYNLARPDEFVFGQVDGESTVRAGAESAVQAVVTASALDDVLTSGRHAIEQRIQTELQQRLDRCRAGVRVLSVRLEDVHPSLEVVDAFRDVSGAFEEKSRLINEAEGYRNEQVALARGNAQASLADANGYTVGRVRRSEGDASRFDQREAAFRAAPGPTETRLYLETIEQVLPGKRKLIVDSTKARRQLYLLEDGVEIGGNALNPMFSDTQANEPRTSGNGVPRRPEVP
ncbi:MAG TPA: FtsH protease activity modulator HflK [Bryobacteraceae bacterium]|nr:FtsH protease activity modulator HflK [Bryobacteraceae bacterium]